MVVMWRREPTDEEVDRLRDAVRELSWHQARTLSGLMEGDLPRSPFDAESLDGAGQRAAVLAVLAAMRDVRDLADELIAGTVGLAGRTGAGGEAIGNALGTSRSAVRKRWPDTVAGASGPRRPVFTTVGSELWGAADQVDER
ncbi:hypothetical protein [Umezawaea sp. Da 62-37]|uniref:hypothetical protein n=1 Tax=Umezawaea sp. Da 62-37 TaxID=3075927 RepID=UPI0028F70358|nr:hypothetical protein [Umezawaea sp. Da 62-37]WNV84935.1 hypothetical protein RM788_43400 [Umezawaea sp. Da 62-37]